MDGNIFESAPIRITETDINDANQLSLHCPICAGAVENNVNETALVPVVCGNCETLYHRACWEGNGGKCAVLGCDHKEYYQYGMQAAPALVITNRDVAGPGRRVGPSMNGNKAFKRNERKMQKEIERKEWWRNIIDRLLRLIRILDE